MTNECPAICSPTQSQRFGIPIGAECIAPAGHSVYRNGTGHLFAPEPLEDATAVPDMPETLRAETMATIAKLLGLDPDSTVRLTIDAVGVTVNGPDWTRYIPIEWR